MFICTIYLQYKLENTNLSMLHKNIFILRIFSLSFHIQHQLAKVIFHRKVFYNILQSEADRQERLTKDCDSHNFKRIMETQSDKAERLEKVIEELMKQKKKRCIGFI